MPTTSADARRSAASRPARDDARGLGPYEAAYDVRRGYDEPAPDGEAALRAAPEPVLIGRRRDR